MKLLIIGSGGREHALAWKLAQSPRVQFVYIAPGNGGTARDKRLHNVPLTDFEALADFVKQEKIAFTVVGPEKPLAAGIVDVFRAQQLKIFGPTQQAAQLESSKVFAKAFMKRHGIPTADYQVFSNAAAAHRYVAAQAAPIVVKADGLMQGKGVVVAQSTDEAHAAIDDIVSEASHSSAPVIIEQWIAGEEASFIVMVDGKHVLPLASSQDHKRLLDGDAGPNTGGMGAYSPAPVITPQMHARVMREIILPAIRGMEQEGMPYTGFLYAGLIIDAQGQPKVLEFNCRMGDPETQALMGRLKSDFSKIIEQGIAATLDSVEIEWDRRTALGVVLAAQGYSQSKPLRTGDLILGVPPDTDQVITFHAGTALLNQQLATAGGRVLCVVGLADSIRSAQSLAYEAVHQIHFDGMQYRHDIGSRALNRKTGA